MAKKKKRLSAKKTAENQGGGFSATALLIPEEARTYSVKKEGKHRIEIIPFTAGEGNPDVEEGDEYFIRTYWTHRNIGPAKNMYVCPAKTAGLPCPVCEARERMDDDPESNEDDVKAMLPKKRQLWNVYDLGEPEKGVQVQDVSYHLFGRVVFAAVRNADEEDDYEYFADPDDGLTLIVTWVEKKFGEKGNAYAEAETVNFKPRKLALPKEIATGGHCLDDMIILVPYDELKAILEGTAADDDDDDDEPPKTKRKAAAKKPPVDDDDDEDDDDVTAASLGIKIGAKVKHDSLGVCTVIKISKDGQCVTLEDDEEEYHTKIGVESVTLPKKKGARKPPKDVPFETEEEPEAEEPKKKRGGKKKAPPKEEADDEKDADWDEDWDEDDD